MSDTRVAGLIDRLVRPAVREIDPYHVPPGKGLVKLDAMENPYTLPMDLVEEWRARLTSVSINRYPDPAAGELKDAIREVFEVPDKSGLILGNGSDELIQMLAILLGGQGRTFLSPAPSFSMYGLISAFTGTGFHSVPLDADFSLCRDRTLQAIRETSPACVLLAYPNNPTGNCFDRDLVCEIIEAAPGLVVLDEAYCLFSGKSFMQQLPDFGNLLVMRTLSKSGLAGLRLGMLMGHPEWIAELEKIRLPYNINSLTQAGATYCLEHYEVLQHQGEMICRDREVLIEEIGKLPGVVAHRSEANFFLVQLTSDAEDVHASLKQHGVLVKNLHKAGSALENCLRITVGTSEENQTLLKALKLSLDLNSD